MIQIKEREVRLNELINKTIYFVNASFDESFTLWQKYNKVVKWESINPGFYEFVGYIKDIKDLPVYIDLHFAEIHKNIICFYSNSSNYSDYNMIEEYINNYKQKSNICVDSTNFFNFEKVLSYIDKDWWKDTEFDTENYIKIIKHRSLLYNESK